MKFIQGYDRTQTALFPLTLEQSIGQDNEVRIIDLFVDNLPLDTYGFELEYIENGRPAYHPSDLLKLYIYGYLNKIRSSRNLEKECKRNIEVMWLLKGLEPDHNTISNFRRDNPKAIKKVFRATVQIAKNFDLIGGELIAGDSTKLRAQNSKKNNFNQKKIDRHVAYNVQTTVDEKHKLPIDYKVTNANDSKAMGNMLRRAKSILRTNDFTALYDKGYHTGSEFKLADDLGIDVMVAIPAVAANAPNKAYNVEHFIYEPTGDYYVCPQGQKLTTTGTLHKTRTYRFKRYTTKACLECPVKDQCSKAKYGKGIQRSEYQHYINQNKERIENNKEYYRQRQAIVEHPYGTVKRQWGFNYIMTKKSIKRAEADVGLIFTAYNFRRLINIIGLKQLMSYLREVLSIILTYITLILRKTSQFKPLNYSDKIIRLFLMPPTEMLIFGQKLIIQPILVK